ncbi:uncharacterized protein C8orf48 homolog isoform X3 [Lissotriton helveticus]
MADRESRFEDSDVESIKTDPNSRSSESNYSDDTFESTTNESDASHSYKSESFESYTYAEETDSRSSSFPQVHPTKGAGEEAADEGRDALQTFCFNKIRQIRHSSSSKKQDCRRKKTTQSRKAATSDVNSAAPSALVNRMYLNNIMATMKQAKEIKIHEPSKCPDCLAKKAKLAKFDFIRRRKTAVEVILLEEKLEEQLYLKDSITLIGEIHRTLPKLSDDPQLVWQRLLESRTT